MKTMMEEQQSELVVLIEKSPLELTTKEALKEQFSDYAAQVAVWKSNAVNLKVTDVSQKSLMKECKVARLAVKDIRVDIEKTRKRLKADSLERGKAIDNIAKYLSSEIEPLEAFLQEQEDFEKNMIAQRMEELKQLRWSKLRQIDGVDPSVYNVEAMSEQVFSDLLDSLHQQAVNRIENERKRIAAEQEEKERLVAEQKAKDEEYARIRKENQEKDRLLKEERKKAELAEANALAEKKKLERKLEESKTTVDTLKKTVVEQKEEIKEVRVAAKEAIITVENLIKDVEKIEGQFVTETDPRKLLGLFFDNLNMPAVDKILRSNLEDMWKTWVKTKFRKL